ncbi:hypothetical protein E4M02_02510 [Brevundimonas sp. S30B]|uniref:hypothetical protein n=1 Tax=unclassified Brevundimonas TaxID=2622653 RepID=UPI00107212B2|nr:MULTISPECIES: hypothetical protein [unclassified Brevundimonas]QBX37237.1 hypothetical protein E4M01_05310 [Brevundimonas sp. MF30-B]TFW03970.1 hypothetical protein E4M02_02510 [Brevundimonas sp. S30B]
MIDVPRLFASTFNATASRNPLAWMIGHKLWYRSWHQVPAGSLPADPDDLCHLAELGFDRKSFDKAKALAMRGWVECEDGRLYHPVVCEVALESWQEKLRQRLASGNGNGKRWGVAFDPAPLAADLEALIQCLERLNPQSKAIMKARKSLAGIAAGIPLGRTGDPSGIEAASHRDDQKPGILSQETGTGTGTLKEKDIVFAEPKTPTPLGDAETPKARRQRTVGPPEFEAAWAAYPHVEGRSSKPEALKHWRALPDEERAGLLDAIGRFKPKVVEVCGGKGAPDMARWLKSAKHLGFVTAASALPTPTFDGPPEVFASVARAAGEDFAQKWLPQCRYDAENRRLVARNAFAAKKLRAELGAWLTEKRVTVTIFEAPAPDQEAA